MWVWVLFIALITIFLTLDLGIFHKNDHVIKTKEAGIWTAIWITVALSFSGVIYWLFSTGLVENPTGAHSQQCRFKIYNGLFDRTVLEY